MTRTKSRRVRFGMSANPPDTAAVVGGGAILGADPHQPAEVGRDRVNGVLRQSVGVAEDTDRPGSRGERIVRRLRPERRQGDRGEHEQTAHAGQDSETTGTAAGPCVVPDRYFDKTGLRFAAARRVWPHDRATICTTAPGGVAPMSPRALEPGVEVLPPDLPPVTDQGPSPYVPPGCAAPSARARPRSLRAETAPLATGLARSTMGPLGVRMTPRPRYPIAARASGDPLAAQTWAAHPRGGLFSPSHPFAPHPSPAHPLRQPPGLAYSRLDSILEDRDGWTGFPRAGCRRTC